MSKSKYSDTTLKTVPLIILTLIAGYNFGLNCKATRYIISRNRANERVVKYIF